jgi:transposase
MEPKQSDTPEFRAEAVKLILEQELSLTEAAHRLAIPKGGVGHLGQQSQRKSDHCSD